jgi:DNA-binding NarL/FixJ family response regulator
MRAGARGYVMKRDATSKVLDANRTVLAGKTYFSPAINAQLAQKLTKGGTANPKSAIAQPSDRELEVFKLLGRGTTTRQISGQLNLSPKTIEPYCARIKEKLNLTNINQRTDHPSRSLERISAIRMNQRLCRMVPYNKLGF